MSDIYQQLQGAIDRTGANASAYHDHIGAIAATRASFFGYLEPLLAQLDSWPATQTVAQKRAFEDQITANTAADALADAQAALIS